jgi:hypothetical protein
MFFLVVVFDDNHCLLLSFHVSVYLLRRFLRSLVSLFHLEFASEYLISELAKLFAL